MRKEENSDIFQYNFKDEYEKVSQFATEDYMIKRAKVLHESWCEFIENLLAKGEEKEDGGLFYNEEHLNDDESAYLNPLLKNYYWGLKWVDRFCAKHMLDTSKLKWEDLDKCQVYANIRAARVEIQEEREEMQESPNPTISDHVYDPIFTLA